MFLLNVDQHGWFGLFRTRRQVRASISAIILSSSLTANSGELLGWIGGTQGKVATVSEINLKLIKKAAHYLKIFLSNAPTVIMDDRV